MSREPVVRAQAPPAALTIVRSRPPKRTLGDKLHELAQRAPHLLAAIEVVVDYALQALNASR